MFSKKYVEWPTAEEINNMDEEEHSQFVYDYYHGVYAKAGYKPTFKQKLKYRFNKLLGLGIALIAIVVIYGIVNLFLVGGQYLWHSGDKEELNKLKELMDNELATIQMYERNSKSKRLSDTEYKHYTDTLNLYNSQVKDYNELAEKSGTTYYVVPGLRGK